MIISDQRWRSIYFIQLPDIPIKAPRENDSEYINRKGFHSLQLQAVCDGNLMFLGYANDTEMRYAWSPII
jgi:hypothetical protein